MSRTDPYSNILHLIGDPGFRTKDDLGSFCLSIGLFNGDPGHDPVDPPRNWNPSNFEIWPMAEIIAYTDDPTIKDLSDMKRYLYPYLLSGIGILEKRIGEMRGVEAMKKIAGLIPP